MAKTFEVSNVFKYFGDVKALDGVTLSADEGTVFGLLGPNGAGKTTLVRLLSTLLTPDRGRAEVLGVDVAKNPVRVREIIGLAGQFAAVDEFLTGRENIYMVGRLYHLPHAEAKQRTTQLLDQLHLSDAADRPVRTYSGGMRRRLDLGASLVGRPKVLFLDEPTTGLDPRTRLDLWTIIRELVRAGTSILLTTQYLEEADELADRIAVMNNGKIIAEGTSDQLKNQLGGDVIEIELTKPSDQAAVVTALQKSAHQKPSVDETGLKLSLPVKNGAKALMDVVEQLNQAKVEVAALALHRPSLDDVFLALTGETTHAAATETAKHGRRKRREAGRSAGGQS